MIPAIVQWEITEKCNFRCQHCYRLSTDRSLSKPKELSDDVMWQIAEMLVQNKLFFITFTGGEPLIRRCLLIDLTEYLFKHGIQVSVNTNLSLINEAVLSDLRVDSLLISCPSGLPEQYREITRTGKYAKFEEQLILVLESGISHTVNMVVHQLNKSGVRQTAQKLAELGVRRFAATPVSLNAGDPRFDLMLSLAEVQQVIEDLIWVHEELGLHVDVMEALPKCVLPIRAFELDLPFVHRSCHAGVRNGAISPIGDVRPCGHNPQTFGNILENNIADVWHNMQTWRIADGNQCTDCLNCSVFSSCGGGCQVDVKVINGQANGRHPYMTDMIVEPFVVVEPKPLLPEMVVRPSSKFHSRREGTGWLVAPGSSRNILQVNNSLYEFLRASMMLKSMTLRELAEKFDTNLEDIEFQRILRLLIKKAYFLVSD